MALPAEALVRGAKLVGFPFVDELTIRAELSYLTDKGLIVADEKRISPEVRRWRLSASGWDFLAEEGL